MVARRETQRDGSLRDSNGPAGIAVSHAEFDVSSPSVEPVDDPASSRANLPAEGDENRAGNQETGEHDGDEDAHYVNYTASGRGYERVPPIKDWCPNLGESQGEQKPLRPLLSMPVRTLVPWFRGIGIEASRCLANRVQGWFRR